MANKHHPTNSLPNALSDSQAAPSTSEVSHTSEAINPFSESHLLSELESPLPVRKVPAETIDFESPVAPGKQLGRYRLVSVLGRGGMGEVWLADDPQLERLVAIKVLRTDRTQSPELIESFLEEGKRLAKIGSDSIVRVFDCGFDQGIFFLVSEYHEEGSLKDYIKRNPPTYEQIVDWVIAIASAAQFAHVRGIVHRDIKPANILMHSDGRPILSDFGLAISEEEQPRARSGALGTCAYMSPEQLRGDANLVDGRADIYSIGIVLYELLTKRLPFKANTFSEYREMVLRRDPWPPRSVIEGIPQALEAICLKCLAKNPGDRYSTAGDLARALREYKRRSSGESRSSPYLLPAAILTTLCAVIALGCVTASLFFRGSEDSSVRNAAFLISPDTPESPLKIEAPSTPANTAESEKPPVPKQETDSSKRPEPEVAKKKPGENDSPASSGTEAEAASAKQAAPKVPPMRENELVVSEVPVYQVSTSVWQIQDEGNSLRISADSPALIQLGTYEGGNLEFSVYIERSKIDSNLGVFWGFEASKLKRLSKRYETWRLSDTTGVKKCIGYSFLTHPIQAPALGGSRGIGGLWLPYAHFEEERPRKIGFELRDGKLHRLIWEDYITYDAYKDRDEVHPEPDTCCGSFGLLGYSASALYSRPTLNGVSMKFVDKSP